MEQPEESFNQRNPLENNQLSRAERNAILGFQRTSKGFEVRSGINVNNVPIAGTPDGEEYYGDASISAPTDWVPIDSTDVFNLARLGLKL